MPVTTVHGERRLERRMITEYEALLDRIGAHLSPATHATALALASLPETIRGYGHVKRSGYETARRRQAELMETLEIENHRPTARAAE
jgi:indolepyruvate ferredoxin oxidoreductase